MQMYTRFEVPFCKHERAKPTDAPQNYGPIREPMPMDFDTSETSAPVFS